MSFKSSKYSFAHLRGKTAIDRNTLATVRTKTRRTDPDGVSNSPYYPSASGKTLRVKYTYMDGGDVTETTEDIALSSSSLAQIITDINAVDSDNLEAIDMGGYLGIRNLNVGRTHFVTIEAYTTDPSDDAAPIIGFTVWPFPGSTSYVGEVASTPGLRQGNPQGTALIGQAEDFHASGINRAFEALLDQLESGFIDLDAPVIGFREFELSFTLQGGSGQYYSALSGAPSDLRIPIFGVDGVFKPQTRYFQILKKLTGNLPAPYIRGSSASNVGTTPAWPYTTWKHTAIGEVVYGDPGDTILVDGTPFATWGIPDGGTIYDEDVPFYDKQPAIAITSIEGDVIFCNNATFQTLKVGKGDPVWLEAATLEPFDHTGWFVVKEVYDEEHIAIRPMAPSEQAPGDGNRPRQINPLAGGTLTVKMGYFIPANNLLIVTADQAPVSGTVVVRIACALPLREALREDLVDTHPGLLQEVLGFLSDHVGNGSAAAHAAEGIRGFNAGTLADTTSLDLSAGNIKTLITNLVGFLASTSTGTTPGGTNKIGSAALAVSGGVPGVYTGDARGVIAGRLYEQLTAVLLQLRDHELDQNRHDSSGVLTGLGNTGTSGLDFSTAAGTLLVNGKYYAPGITTVTTSNNTNNWIYVDGSDGLVKTTTNQATAHADTNMVLYKATTSSGNVTVIIDVRRQFTAARKKATITVGPQGCDFTTLQGAVAYTEWYRQQTSVGVPSEIVIQDSVDLATTITLSFPIIIRGVALDGSALGGGPKARLRGTLAGQPMFRCSTATLHNVTFKDLYVEVESTNSASCFFKNDDAGTCGNDWLFENCVFNGAPDGGYTLGISPTAASRGWTWRHCTFQGRTGSGYFVGIGDNCNGYAFFNCKFLGTVANNTVSGVNLSEGAIGTHFDRCIFEMGGVHATVQSTTDQTRFTNCRFWASIHEAIFFISSGDLSLEKCYFFQCMQTSSNSRGVIMSDAGTGSIAMLRCHFKNWDDGYAIRALGNTGAHWSITSCKFTATGADRAVIGLFKAEFSNNIFDMSPGAAVGSGHSVAHVVSTGDGSRIIGNTFRNCGNNGNSANDQVVIFGSNSVVAGNTFANCRGKLTQTSDNNSSVYGNVSFDNAVGGINNIGFWNGGKDNASFGNRWPDQSSGRILENLPALRIHQNWMAPMFAAWTTGTAGVGAAVTSVVDPDVDKPGRWLLLTCPGTVSGTGRANKYSETVTGGPLTPNMALVMECSVDATALNASTDFHFQVGLSHDETLMPSNEDQILFTVPQAAGFWHCVTKGVSSSDFVTNVAVGGVQHLRIEVTGSDDPVGARATFWINGNLVSTITANLPDSNEMVFMCGIQNIIETGGNVNVYVSPMTLEIKYIDRPV